MRAANACQFSIEFCTKRSENADDWLNRRWTINCAAPARGSAARPIRDGWMDGKSALGPRWCGGVRDPHEPGSWDWPSRCEILSLSIVCRNQYRGVLSIHRTRIYKYTTVLRLVVSGRDGTGWNPKHWCVIGLKRVHTQTRFYNTTSSSHGWRWCVCWIMFRQWIKLI